MIDKGMAKRKDVTKEQIIEATASLVSAKGCNGFSTRQLADEVGISSASLHHHFTTKGDLIAAVAAACRDRVNERLAVIAAEVEGFALRVQHCREAVQPAAMLLAMSAADFPTLPVVAQNEVRQLFSNVLGWLGRFATQGRADGDLSEESVTESVANQILSEVLGAAMLQRVTLPGALTVPPMTWGWQRPS